MMGINVPIHQLLKMKGTLYGEICFLPSSKFFPLERGYEEDCSFLTVILLIFQEMYDGKVFLNVFPVNQLQDNFFIFQTTYLTLLKKNCIFLCLVVNIILCFAVNSIYYNSLVLLIAMHIYEMFQKLLIHYPHKTLLESGFPDGH